MSSEEFLNFYKIYIAPNIPPIDDGESAVDYGNRVEMWLRKFLNDVAEIANSHIAIVAILCLAANDFTEKKSNGC